MTKQKTDVSDYVKAIVLERIPNNRTDAIKLPHLATLLNLTQREVKMAIHALREEHAIVFQEKYGGGYWIAEDASQLRNSINILESRRNALNYTIDRLQAHYDDYVDKGKI